MHRLAVMSAVALTLAAPCLAAELVTLPLELGADELFIRVGDTHHLLAFDAERDLATITEARLHVTGTYKTEMSICWSFGNYGAGVWFYPEDPGLDIGFRDGDGTPCLTRYEFTRSEAVVSFDYELTFDCGGETADWSFLAGGAGTVYLTGLPCEHFASYPEVCICEHSSSVTSAELVIQLGTGVPADQSSWGTIKAEYR